ncbi:uncharacterized protein METZ01_LOCUS436567, partial [marine metagenome]
MAEISSDQANLLMLSVLLLYLIVFVSAQIYPKVRSEVRRKIKIRREARAVRAAEKKRDKEAAEEDRRAKEEEDAFVASREAADKRIAEEEKRIAQEKRRERAPSEAVASEDLLLGRNFWFYSFLIAFFLAPYGFEIIGDISTIWGYEFIISLNINGPVLDFYDVLLGWLVFGLAFGGPTAIFLRTTDADDPNRPITILAFVFGLFCFAVFCYGVLALWVHQLVNFSS